MNLISRMLRCFLIFTALLLTGISLSANWLFERRSLADWFDDCAALLEAERKGMQLALESQETLNRVFVKTKIAEALRNGEMTLIDAAAIFRSLYEEPKAWHDPRKPRPAFNDKEGWCREVIHWTEHYSFPDNLTSQAQALHQRLEAELQKLMDGKGAVTPAN